MQELYLLIEAIRNAYQEGCTFFDTAETYGKEMFEAGHNERLVGKAVEPLVTKETIQKAHELTPVTAVQNLYSLLERDCEDDVFPYCLDNQIGVVAFSPIASGLLSGKVTSETKFEGDDVRKFVPQLTQENIVKNQPIIDILHQFAKEKEATPAQISLAWMLHKYPNVVPIPDPKNKDRIIENLQASSITLSNEEFKKLEKALAQHQVFGHRGHNESENPDFSKKWKNK